MPDKKDLHAYALIKVENLTDRITWCVEMMDAQYNRKLGNYEGLHHRLHYPFLKRVFSSDDGKVFVKLNGRIQAKKNKMFIFLNSEDHGRILVEIMTDYNVRSSNIIFEDVYNIINNTTDGKLISETSILSYGFCIESDKHLRRQIIFDLKDLLKWYSVNSSNYHIKSAQYRGYEFVGREIPIHDLSDFIIASDDEFDQKGNNNHSYYLCSIFNPVTSNKL